MKVIFVGRLYSGFEESLRNAVWQPGGLPSIYKWLDFLEERAELRILFTAKDSGSTYQSNWLDREDVEISLNEFRNSIKVMAGYSRFKGRYTRKIRMILRDIIQCYTIIREVYKFKPDLIYVDSANVIPASILSVIQSRPVVLRVLGACSWWWSVPQSKRWIDKLYKIALRARFDLAVGSKDGSRMDLWFDRVLHLSTPRVVLLNGVDIEQKPETRPYSGTVDQFVRMINSKGSGRQLVGFVGRLEPYKGITTFINAIIICREKFNLNVHGLVVGDGSMKSSIIAELKDKGRADYFSFTGNLAHADVLKLHKIVDLYVSPNIDANLTNSNLEALSAGSLLLLLDNVERPELNVETKEIFEDAATYFQDNGDGFGLSISLKKLIGNHDLRKSKEEILKKVRRKVVYSWYHRFNTEYQLLEELVKR